MPIPVSSNLVPREGQTYPVVEDTYLRGGMRVVDSYDDLLNIDPLSLKLGMLAVDSSTDLSTGGGIYQLTSLDLTDPESPVVEWSPLTQGGGASTNYKGYWESDIQYSEGDLVQEESQVDGEWVILVYMATGNILPGRDSPANSTNGDWIKLGPDTGGGGSYRGTYDPAETYVAGDIVYSEFTVGGATTDACWLCVQTNPVSHPTYGQDAPSWVLIGSGINYPVGNTVNLVGSEYGPDYGTYYLKGAIVKTTDDTLDAGPRVWLCLQDTDRAPLHDETDGDTWVCLNRENVYTIDMFIADANVSNTVLDGKVVYGNFKVVGLEAIASQPPPSIISIEICNVDNVMATATFDIGSSTPNISISDAYTNSGPNFIGARCSLGGAVKGIMLRVRLEEVFPS